MSPELSPSEPRRRVRRTVPPPRRPAARPVGWRPLLALLPLACVVLGGGTARWSQGVVLLGLGGVLLGLPPRESLGRGLDAVLGGVVLLALMAFAPAGWFSQPAWRAALTGDFGTTLPATLSPQPWLSAEGLVVLLAGMSWLYLMGTMRWTDAERLRAGRIFAAGAVGLAGVFVTLFKLDVVVPFWINERHFGPFPNRNQTADFLAVAALPVLACAYVDWRAKRRLPAAGWLVGWMVVALALFNNFSRAGVGLLFVGTAAYLVVETVRSARQRRSYREVKEGDPLPDLANVVARWRRVALAASLILVLASGFFLFGGDTLGRFQFDSAQGAESVVTDAFRLQIQRDAVGMIAASPWCGVGLDNFAPVFEEFRRRSALPLWIVHPESDWLWMSAELGWPALVLTLAASALLLRRMRPWRRGVDRPLRTAAMMAAVLFALHGLVDVSAHRLGTALCALFLLGLAMPGRGEQDAPGGAVVSSPARRWPVVVFRGLGVILLGAGALWLLESSGQVTAPGEVGVARLKAQAAAASNARDYAAAEAAEVRALAWAPLDWQLYFARGVTVLCARNDVSAALDDFRRARFLEPFAGETASTEAAVWAMASQPALAVNALAEACRREPARAAVYIDGVTGRATEGRDAFHERFQRSLRHDPTLTLAYLQTFDPDRMGAVIAGIVSNNPDLTGFNDTQKATLFRHWARTDDGHALDAAMAAHPAWQKIGWRWWATACGKIGQEEQACGIARRYASSPRIPPTLSGTAMRPLADLEGEVARAPKDPAAALQLYRAQRAAGDSEAALRSLHRITVQRGCPPYFYYLEALQAAEVGQWVAGWDAWGQYLEQTSQAE